MNTMPRTEWRIQPLSYAQAHRLLNRRRNGEEMDVREVLRALEMTGDYDPEAPPAGYEQLWEVQ